MSEKNIKFTKQNICNNISIVMQGPLSVNSIKNISENCRIWKKILPNSEIILSISHTDEFEIIDNRKIIAKKNVLCDTVILDYINYVCHSIIIIHSIKSLPEIKRDSSGKNNINYQIRSSFFGLEKSTKDFALKIRSDIVFNDTNFIDFYLENFSINRGKRMCLQNRVLISSIYTLNPFSKERMPFHFSDWFQFGTINDLKTIWNIDDFSFNDAIFYKKNAYAEGSNSLEKLFLTRIAVEQYVTYSLAKKFFPDLQLRYHNDTTSILDSIDFLIDNFIIMDATNDCINFPKYSKEIIDYNNIQKCISYKEWLFMSKNRIIDFKKFLMKNEDIFYLVFGPKDLFCKDSLIEKKTIINSLPKGTLSYGPYFDIKKGDYFCDILFDEIYGFGYLIIKITTNFGKKTISKNKFFIFGKKFRKKIMFQFSVESDFAESVEIVINYKFFERIKLSRIIIHD